MATEITTAVFADAFRTSNFTLVTEMPGEWQNNISRYNINVSSTLTKLIQETGRLVKSHASDLFISWGDFLNKAIKTYHSTGTKLYFVFGLRKSGVDHDTYVLTHVDGNPHSHMHYHYSEIFIVEAKYYDNKIAVELKDCIDSLNHIQYSIACKSYEPSKDVKTKIQDIKAGDSFMVNGVKFTAKYDARQNFDEPDEPWIVYDTDDCSWFEDDIEA